MDAEERLEKVKALNNMIIDLKKSNIPNSKRTIQKLQIQIDEILYE